MTGKKQRAPRARSLCSGQQPRAGPWPMATLSSTTIVRMTEPLSLLPRRLTHKAKERSPAPNRVTLSSGQEGQSPRTEFSVPPPPACHPVAFKPNPDPPVCPWEAGSVLCEAGDGLVFRVLSVAFKTLPQLWGWGLRLTFLVLHNLALAVCL